MTTDEPKETPKQANARRVREYRARKTALGLTTRGTDRKNLGTIQQVAAMMFSPHERAAGVRTIYRHQARMSLLENFGLAHWYAEQIKIGRSARSVLAEAREKIAVLMADQP